MDGLILMDVAFTIFIIIHLFFIKENLVKKGIDKSLSIGAIILYLYHFYIITFRF